MPTAAMPASPVQLSVEFLAPKPQRVDREKGVIYGGVCALAGVFKDRRGQFVERSLSMIREQMAAAPRGLRSRFTHPGLSADGLGKFLGRWHNPHLGEYEGKPCVRADLHISPTSRDTPSGDLGGYVLRLAEEDPEAISSSLVIEPEEEYMLEKDGTRKKDVDGEPLPAVWFPKKLWALDIVDTGDAVDGLLSAHSLTAGGAEIDRTALPDALQRQGFHMLDRMFGDAADDVILARMTEYTKRYLTKRAGGKSADEVRDRSDAQRERLKQILDAGVDAGVLSPFETARLLKPLAGPPTA